VLRGLIGKVVIVYKEELERQNVELPLYGMDDNSQHLKGKVVEVEESYIYRTRALYFSKIPECRHYRGKPDRPPDSRWVHRQLVGLKSNIPELIVNPREHAFHTTNKRVREP